MDITLLLLLTLGVFTLYVGVVLEEKLIYQNAPKSKIALVAVLEVLGTIIGLLAIVLILTP